MPAVAALLSALAPAPALANDSEAEWALGGLVLKPSEAIAMDAEELYISADEVRVDYRYTNRSDTDRTVLVSFPLPALPDGGPDWVEYGAYPDWGDLGFSTTIDGKPAAWQQVRRALVGERDVTALVEAEHFPLEWYQDYEFIERIGSAPEAEIRRLAQSGLVRREAGWGGNDYRPAWQVQTSITREQTFPARATVHVAHRYAPRIGGSVGGMLDRYGEAGYGEETAYYDRKFCTDAGFIAGVRKRNRAESAKSGGDYVAYGETWIGYVLSSGANWQGPIGDFRLVVDKGRPDNLVSLCMDGVTKISPTQFEVRKKDYEPDRDLNVLIVHWYDPAED